MNDGVIESFRGQIIRLENELEKTNNENVKAAELGLLVLEEKQLLQKKVKEIEASYEQSQYELGILQEAFRRSELQNLKQNQESASEEETQMEKNTYQIRELSDHIKYMESEIRALRSDKERVLTENEEHEKVAERLSSQQRAREIEWEKLVYKMREMEKRENKMLADISEIEDENIALQKQIVSIRINHMECESLRLEMDNMREQKYIQTQKLEESEMLRNILKKQLEETSELLEREKHMRQATKREMEEMKLLKGGSANTTSNGHGPKASKRRCDKSSDEEPMASEYEDYLNLTTNAELTAMLMDEDPSLLCGMNGMCSENDGDLYNEMHNSEISELRSRLESALAERDELALRLDDLKSQKVAVDVVDASPRHRDRVADQTENLTSLQSELERKSKALYTREEDIVMVQSTVQAIRSSQLPTLVTRVSSYMLDQTPAHGTPRPSPRPNGLAVSDTEEEENSDSVNDTTNLPDNGDVGQVEPDVSQSAPNVREAVNELKKDLKKLEVFLLEKFLPSLSYKMAPSNRPSHHRLDTSLDGIGADIDCSDNEFYLSRQQHEHLLREIQRLKAVVVSKRSKNLHYRSVLQSYKTTAEVCFSKMQAKYAEERQVVSDTLSRYRQELGVYKEDCQTLAGQLSALRAECRDLNQSNASLRSRVDFLDSERKTLNSMLKTAIQQKFALIQKVESLECFNFFPPNHSGLNEDDDLDAKAAFSRLNGPTTAPANGRKEATVFFKNGTSCGPHHPSATDLLLNKFSTATKLMTSSPLASRPLHATHTTTGSPRTLTQMFPQISLLSRKAFTNGSFPLAKVPPPSHPPSRSGKEMNGANHTRFDGPAVAAAAATPLASGPNCNVTQATLSPPPNHNTEFSQHS